MKRIIKILIVGLVFFLLFEFGNLLSRFFNHATPRVDQKSEFNWKAQYEHARSLSYLQKYEEAEQEYRKLLEIKPDSNDVLLGLGKILYYQKNYFQALELLQKIPTEKLDDESRLLIADIYQSLHDYQKAEMIYYHYLEAHPDDHEALLKYAELLSWDKKYQSSLEIYKQILDSEPNNIQVRRQYALVLIWSGKESEGVEELKKTLKEND